MKKLLSLLSLLCIALLTNAQIVINEVQADAGNNEGGGEWLELKNIGASSIDVSCWKITNGGNVQITFPQGLLIGAGEYLLIGNAAQMMCASCDFKSLNTQFTLNPDGFGYGVGAYTSTQFLNLDLSANGGCGCLTGSGGFNNGSLNGDRIILTNDAGVIQDAMMYGSGSYYGSGALTVNFAGNATCAPLLGVTLPAVGDIIYDGRIICNDLGGCNSSYARLPDGNNAAVVTYAQSGNLGCTGCLDPCGASTNAASADFPTPGISNTSTPWIASLNASPVLTSASNLTVCGATPITFEYQINNFTNVALTPTQSTGNLGSYVRVGNATPIAFSSSNYNTSTGITILSSTVTPPAGITTYEFVWGDANTLCGSCPGSTSTSTPNNASSTAKECYVYHTVTVLREEPLGGTPVVSCSLPGSIVINAATGTNIEYTLQKQTSIGGPFITIAGPQVGNSFAGIIDDDADPLLPNYQVLVSSVNTVCANPTPIIALVPNTCLGNPACAKYETSGPGMPTFSPAGGLSVCAGTAVTFNTNITGICNTGLVEVMYDFNAGFDPYTQGFSLGTTTTTVGATPPTTTAPGVVYISEFVPRPYNVAPCASDGNNPNSGEYVELYNAGPGNVDISGWMLTDGDWTATIPAGVIMAANSYYLIGGGGTQCATGAMPDLNVETCNCTGGTNNPPSGTDFMNFTNTAEGFGLFDCSNNFIDGVKWGSWSGDVDGSPASLPAGCGNYLNAKTPVLPAGGGNQGFALTNSGGSFSGSNGGRARDVSGNWTVTVNNSQFGAGFNGTPKAANGAFVMWNGTTIPVGTQCPPPPVNATIIVTLPDTCSQIAPLNITLKAIYKPQPVSPCTMGDVTASATYTIPTCPLLTLSGNGEYCNPANAPLSLSPNVALLGNYDITLSNGINTANILGATGSGPFATTVSNSGVWTISNVIPPSGICPPKTEGSATVNILDIPSINSAPTSANFCYSFGYDLSALNWQITTTPSVNNFVWYDQSSGGSPIPTFVNPTSNTTYYVAPTTGNPANCEGTRVPVLLMVDPLPAVPTVSCNGISAIFTPQSPNCNPIPCVGIDYSANGINWSSNTTYTAADPGWAGWGSPLNSTLYIRNSGSVNCFSYVTFFNPCTAALPAQLINFNGTLLGNGKINLTWETMNEDHVSYFEVEKGYSNSTFTLLNKVKANGLGANLQRYNLLDEQPYTGVNYYRLKVKDEDGQFVYSNTITILSSSYSNSIVSLYPNPTSSDLNMNLNLIKKDKAQVQIVDMTGRIVVEQSEVLNAGINNLNIKLNTLAQGHYLVRIVLGKEVLVGKFVKE